MVWWRVPHPPINRVAFVTVKEGVTVSAQLVALRFAGDGELADLVREVLAGKLASQKAIKLAIKDWKGDHLPRVTDRQRVQGHAGFVQEE